VRRLGLALAGGGLLAAACLGTAARETATLPALQNAWQSLREQCAREVVASGEVAAAGDIMAADDALASGDATRIAAVNWTRLEALAEGDVTRRAAAGDLSPGAAGLLSQRVSLFREARIAFVTVTP
jgi:hypothetical protein